MADATRCVSVRLSIDGAQQAKQDLREAGESGQRSLERIKDGTDRASRALDLLDGAVRGRQTRRRWSKLKEWLAGPRFSDSAPG